MYYRCLNNIFKYCREVPEFEVITEVLGDRKCSLLILGCHQHGNGCAFTLAEHFKGVKFPPANYRHTRVYKNGSVMTKLKE